MKTPWGELRDLDLANHATAAEILSADKHTLLEGLVVESLFDQIVANVPSVSGEKITALDVESVVVDTQRSQERWIAFVWVRNKSAGLARYLARLSTIFTTFLVNYEDGEFFAVRMNGAVRVGEPQLLSELMTELSGKPYSPFKVNTSVRDSLRQQQAIWGFLFTQYRDRVGERVVLPRLFINCAIQPYFQSVWNLDRVFVIDKEVWIFEIKHKFPMSSWRGLSFGINDGELQVLSKLADAGIKCLHTILVKPYWTKNATSMYLLTDLEIRDRAAVIATVLDRNTLDEIGITSSSTAGRHTSVNGESSVKFKSIDLGKFSKLGQFSDPAREIASNMSALMDGGSRTIASADWLKSLRAEL
ncbi:hypothetical protein J8I26_12805 [Herbaspirillum sp. LeCh32-8]|uniref:hypothetical protein n=1 Tax=Herbaspirillum sp. LeCh32-8 TaxID=2821356 RepID=UPI001AE205AF|nr:hypothetical protein [Herbaspirillum sp. LeCh32-8]MBP0598994.1 hypothetical protein [Herbaspirillum sp. LeCh32-8]